MSKPPIANLDQTVKDLEGLAFFRNFAALTFNRHVEAVYWKSTEDHKQARRALLIVDRDSQIAIVNKQMLFFFALQKLTQQVEDHISFAKGTAPIDPNMIRCKVVLRPTLLYKKDGTSVGNRSIVVPHVDESKLGELRDFHFIHGSTTRLYAFADKKQIKVIAIDEKEGNRAINQLLRIVNKNWLLGDAESHGYTGKPPEDMDKPDLYNIRSNATGLDVSDSTGELYRLLI